jgi:glycerol-3-phosphate acyltransferase PlsX
MLPIALDAMGGDHAPGEVIAGARLAQDELGVPIVLVGRPEMLEDVTDVEVRAASEVIAMDEDPAQGVRRKKDSSLVRCAELVRDKQASAMVSAGNTGATMASALLRMGRIKGVSRPAIAIPLPVLGRLPTTLLDAGANAEVQPEWLVQFAQMGSVFARHRFPIARPRVGLLSIGEEPGKGTPLVKETHALMASAPGISFIGNVEGRDVLTDDVDVVVTDGFTGNVVLKTLEGALDALVESVLTGLQEHASADLDVDAAAKAVAAIRDRLHPENTGGAMLLGVDGVCIISHGSSSARAIFNAVRVAVDMVNHDVVGELRAAIGAA